MPFECDLRCGWCQIQLNKCSIAMLFRDYDKEVIINEAFHNYCEALEYEFNKVVNFHTKINWHTWFDENYNSIEEYNELTIEEIEYDWDN